MNLQETNVIFNKIVQARWQARRRIQEALQVLDGQGKVRKAFHQIAAIVMRMRNDFYPLWNMILMPWYVSGAKLRTLAFIPIPDDRLSLLLPSSCWIELRCNIYTSLKTNWSRKPGFDVPRIVCTQQWPMCVLGDHMWPRGPQWLREYIVTWTMNYVFPTAPLSIVTHLTWKFFLVVFAKGEYIWSVRMWCTCWCMAWLNGRLLYAFVEGRTN